MTTLPFHKGDWQRGVAKEASLRLKNRYFEENPVLSEDGVSAIARPGLKKYMEVGDGPIRGIYSVPGAFNDALFVVSGTEWYRVEVDGSTTLLKSDVADLGAVSMAGTGSIEAVPAYVFLADGASLWVHVDGEFKSAVLSGTPSNNDSLRMGDLYYKFTTGSVDTGTPDGTSANPWLVAVGTSPEMSHYFLSNAVNATGTAGVEYSTGLTVQNPRVLGYTRFEDTTAYLARNADDEIIPVEETGGLTWTPTGFMGTSTNQVFKVPTPDDIGMISVGYVASHVVCIPAQGGTVNGRFYWIRPGEITIDPLDYATAERAPDPVSSVVVFGDKFWLPGSTTTEVWYFTGSPDAPVQRLQGVTFDRGAWNGTATQVKDSMIIVDADGSVFIVSGGIKRISDPSIEERIRNAINEV